MNAKFMYRFISKNKITVSLEISITRFEKIVLHKLFFLS